MKTKLTRQQAWDLAATEWWKNATSLAIASFQLNEDRLCCPFGVFHKSVEDVLGRPVWSHEFADADALREEMNGICQAQTIDEILDMIPEAKRIIVEIKTTA